MKIYQALIIATNMLRTSSNTPSLDARLLLCHSINYLPENLLMNSDKELEFSVQSFFFL